MLFLIKYVIFKDMIEKNINFKDSLKSISIQKLTKIMLILLIFLYFFIFSHPLLSSESILTEQEIGWLKKKSNSLNLYFETNFPPIEFLSEADEFIGMSSDIIKIIEKNSP